MINICDLLFQAVDATKYLIEDKVKKGLSEDDAINEIVDEVIQQTELESEMGVCHGVVEVNSNLVLVHKRRNQ